MTETQVNILKSVLKPYQYDWVIDDSRFKMGMWSRQTGKSFATAAESTLACQINPGDTWVVLSAGERQALEWMEKAKQWAEAFKLVIDSSDILRGSANALMTKSEIRFVNGSRIIAIPANPDTARGYSANLVLDEFAIHERSFDIWAAIYPSITNPLTGEKKLRIVSTPKGRGNKFADLWAHNTNYSKHKVTIEDAVSMGLPVDIEQLRAGVDDPDIWAQEFMCDFIDSSSVLLSYELIGKCESEAIVDPGDCPLYIGMDVGRSKDLSVIVSLAKLGDVYYMVDCQELVKTPFHDQLEVLIQKCLENKHRLRGCSIDATGIGAMLAEEARRKIGCVIEEFKFTSSSKSEIYTVMRRQFEERAVRIPVNRNLREDLHGIQKNVSTGGNISYSAPRSADGHSDRASALALALHAAKKQGLDLEKPMIFGASRFREYDLRGLGL